MSISIKPEEFSVLRNWLEKACGILLAKDKSYLVESRLGALLTEKNMADFSELNRHLQTTNDLALRDKIVDLMTTNETLWFRDSHPFVIFDEVLLPRYIEEIQAGRRNKIRIWSSACSTGQEPYSLAMLFLEKARHKTILQPQHLEIIASDISTTALLLARAGRYDTVSISRGLPQNLKDKYFRQEGRVFLLDDSVKKMVTLKKFNLQDSFALFGRFDLILCRNVMIYFSDEFKRDLFRKFHGALAPDGDFFLGASESMSAYSQSFEMKEYKRGIYYKAKSTL